MATTYFASHLSDNILVTPPVVRDGMVEVPGTLICKDAVIARTGFQTYRVGDLPQKEAAKLGVDLSNPNATIDLYRPAEEVFSPATMASFEGVTVCDDHPADFVARDNWRKVSMGHVQAVRKGWEALSDGEWPLIGDIVINGEPLWTKVESGEKRELSCGYSYDLKKDGDLLIQSGINGNHVAVVDRGRAGPEARIYDSADQTINAKEEKPPQTESVAKPEVRPLTKKEKHPVKNPLMDLLGRGLRALATDTSATDEQIAEAAMAVNKAKAADSEESEEEKRKKESDAKRMKDAEEKERKEKEEKDAKDMADKKAKDESEKKDREEKDAKDKAEKDAKDAADRAKDEAEKSHYAPCKVKDCNVRDCRMHDAFDEILKAHPEEDDADMNELKDIMSEFMGGGGAQHDEGSGVIEPIMDSEEEREKEEEADKALAADAVEREAEFAFLKRIRPTIAKSNDKAAITDFNARLGLFTKKSKANNGASYGAFARSAATGRDDKDGLQKKRDPKALDEVYAQLRSKDLREVK